MAEYAGVSQWQVRKVWAAARLKPHRLKGFRISDAPQFAEKVIDVVGLYSSPPDNAMVLSVDEKTRIQALDRTRPLLPMRPGRIDRLTPSGLDLHIILDNGSTHKTEELDRFLEEHPRFHFRLAPTSASWLNAVANWFSPRERRAIYRGIFTGVAELRRAIRAYIEAHNQHAARPFKWNKSAQAILEAVERAEHELRMRTSMYRTGHRSVRWRHSRSPYTVRRAPNRPRCRNRLPSHGRPDRPAGAPSVTRR